MTSRRTFDLSIALVCSGALALALATLPLAMLGVFRPYFVFPLALVLWFVLFALWNRGWPDEPTPVTRGAFAVVLVTAIVFAGVTAKYSSQHVLTNRDPGVYNTTARWLATHGSLLVDRDDEAYAGLRDEARVRFDASGYYQTDQAPKGKLFAQFAHLFPSIVAATAWIGGSHGMMRTNAILGAIGLLLFFAFCSRLMSPWVAAAATVALASNPIQNHFSRDAFTEITSQVFLFGALWLLWSARRMLDPGKALLAGLAWGAMCMARIDAFTLLVPLGAYVVYELWAGPDDAPARRHRLFCVWLASGAAISSLIGAADLAFFSPVYVYDLRKQVIRIAAGLVLVVVGGSAGLALRRALGPIRSWGERNRVLLANLVVLAGAAGATYAYAIRPHVELATQPFRNALVEGLQGRLHLPIDGHRTYSEMTFRWIGLYFGLPALVACVAGMLFLIRRTITGREKYVIPFLFVFVSMSALYLWSPQITPDQIWAMRRFLPVTVPGLIIGCFWLVDRFVRTRHVVAIALAAAVGVAAIGYPAYVEASYVTERTQLGLLGATEALCDRLPPNAAVIVAQGRGLDRQFTQTVRAFCNIPSASVPPDEEASWYRDIARRWDQRGRALFALSSVAPFGPKFPVPMERFAFFTYHDLQLTIEGRPHGVENTVFSLYLAPVPP